MRLLNTSNLGLEEFASLEGVKYGILSHRWEEEEVSFHEFHNLRDAKQKKGFQKIAAACRLAKESGFDYVWIDTCCIDKSSSAELSEAINSMFRWYQQASVCWVYLSDVQTVPLDVEEFKTSLWFTRGWTLQELLAPQRVAFMSLDWVFVGWKHDLVEHIASITGIDQEALSGTDVLTFSISQRMSWASKRRTTRIEDRAYSLMGLFNVNIPLLYGEGQKAFIRLQEEIIKHSEDHTIFAWTGVTNENCGLLAPSLDHFATTPRLTPVIGNANVESPYSMTNRGLSIDFDLSPWGPGLYLARLACFLSSGIPEADYVAIYVRRVRDKEQYWRVTSPDASSDLYIAPDAEPDQLRYFRKHRITIRQKELATFVVSSPRTTIEPQLNLRLEPFFLFDNASQIECHGTLNTENNIMQLDYISSHASTCASQHPRRAWGRLLTIDMRQKDHFLGMALFGFDFQFEPVCVVTHKSKHLAACRAWQKNTPLGRSRQNGQNVQRPFDRITCMETEGWDISDSAQVISFLSPFGIWAVKGSRGQGLRANLFIQPPDHSEEESIFYVHISIRPSDDRTVWVVSFRSSEWSWDWPVLFY